MSSPPTGFAPAGAEAPETPGGFAAGAAETFGGLTAAGTLGARVPAVAGGSEQDLAGARGAVGIAAAGAANAGRDRKSVV